jgi:hypothetical protein
MAERLFTLVAFTPLVLLRGFDGLPGRSELMMRERGKLPKFKFLCRKPRRKGCGKE